MEALLINLVSGAVGGNVAGGLLKNLNQGTLINSISGIVGGGDPVDAGRRWRGGRGRCRRA